MVIYKSGSNSSVFIQVVWRFSHDMSYKLVQEIFLNFENQCSLIKLIGTNYIRENIKDIMNKDSEVRLRP